MENSELLTPFSGDDDEHPVDDGDLAHELSRLSDANKRLRRKIFDHYTVFEISRHLSSMLDTESLIDAILLTCLGQMGVENAVMFLTDKEMKVLTNPHTKGIENDNFKQIKINYTSSLTKAFLQSGKPMTSLELTGHIKGDSGLMDLMRHLDVKLAAPLLMKDRLLGILFLPRKMSNANYYENDLEFLSLLMNQLSVALENAQLYERERYINEQLQQTQKLLVETEKMAALGKLSASIAHEVNNPLGIISNYLQILSMRKIPDDLHDNYIKILKEEVNRIAGIVRQLLAFYRPHQQNMAMIDINKVIAESLALLSNQLSNANIDVYLNTKRDIPNTFGSSEKLKQVFLNLIMNARDFMQTGGEITINASSENDSIKIEVQDTGPGISDEHLNVLFEPFFTTKEKEGTGLGLAVCYGIIKSHNGTIIASNNEKGGATFTIKLPIAKEDDGKNQDIIS